MESYWHAISGGLIGSHAASVPTQSLCWLDLMLPQSLCWLDLMLPQCRCWLDLMLPRSGSFYADLVTMSLSSHHGCLCAIN